MPPHSGMSGARNSSSSSDGLAPPPVATNSNNTPSTAAAAAANDGHTKSAARQSAASSRTPSSASGHVSSSLRSAETAVREVVVRTKSLFRGSEGRSSTAPSLSAVRRRGSSDLFSRRRGDSNTNTNSTFQTNNNNSSSNSVDSAHFFRKANSSHSGSANSQVNIGQNNNSNNNNSGNNNNNNACDIEDKYPERTKLNHHITLAGVRPPEGMSTSGLPAVRMSTLSNIVLPSTFHFEPLEDTTAVGFTQAGGHTDTFRSNGPVLEKKVCEREAKFYEEALVGMWPVQFLPKFFGRTFIDKTHPAIKIENLTYGLKNPCVMDLKMGFQSVENTEPSLRKRLRHIALDHLTGSKHSGVRLEGLSMYRTLEKRKMKGSKIQSHTVSANMGVSLQDVLTFFLTDESGVRTDIALRFQAHIEALLHYFCKYNTDKLFIGSSILLIYDNDNSAPHMRWARALQKLNLGVDNNNNNNTEKSNNGDDCNNNNNIINNTEIRKISPDRLATLTRKTKVDVRMIDFAHTGKLPMGQLRDEGYIQGLHTILTALKAIRADRKKPIFTLRNAALDALAKKESTPSAAADNNESSSTTARQGVSLDLCKQKSKEGGYDVGDTRTLRKEGRRNSNNSRADNNNNNSTESQGGHRERRRRKGDEEEIEIRENNNNNNTATHGGSTSQRSNSSINNAGRSASDDTAFNFATLYEQCSAVSTDSVIR